jgi:hypothetical protein
MSFKDLIEDLIGALFVFSVLFGVLFLAWKMGKLLAMI